MLFCSISGLTRGLARTTDGQGIPGSGTQHAGVTGPIPDPRDLSSLPMLKGSPGRHPADKISGWCGPASLTRLPITASVMECIRGQLESSSHPHKEHL